MKLASVIVVAIGFYLCAVSEAGGGEGSSSSHDEGRVPLLQPIEGDGQGKKPLFKKFREFFKSHIINEQDFTEKFRNFLKSLVISANYEEFLNGKAPNSDRFDKDKKGFEDYKRYMEFLENYQINDNEQGYQKYIEYKHVLKNSQVDREVELLFGKFIGFCKEIPEIGSKMAWNHLMFADKKFKKQCYRTFEKRTWLYVNDELELVAYKQRCQKDFYNTVYKVIKNQMEATIKDLLFQLLGLKIDVEVVTGHFSCEQLLEMMKVWFTLARNENNLKTKIEDMRREYILQSDDAAKVLIFLKKFPVLFAFPNVPTDFGQYQLRTRPIASGKSDTSGASSSGIH